ncbi:MAG TPA: serine--tRNA ligase, partial [Verrucomicrobiae bacterium]|nr:serine--tRNA ligase [Verrucomicrobiae bacterium]
RRHDSLALRRATPIISRVLDIKLIREKPDFVRERLTTRGADDAALIEKILHADEQRRKTLAEVETLKARRNRVSKEIGALMGQKKLDEAEARKKETRDLGDQIAALDQIAEAATKELDTLMLRVPNLPHDSVPFGKSAEDNPEIRVHGAKPNFAFKPKSHVELCESLKLVDFARGAKLSGSGFILYTNWGAKLERALIQFLLDLHTAEHDYTEVSPPFIINENCMFGVGQFPKSLDQAYAVREGLDDSTLGKLYLIPTAESPVANIHREEILKEDELPIRYCAYSPCFRAEAGAAGVGTRGMIRVHQFDKVELIKIVKPENGYDELEKLVTNAEKVLQLLGLHYRVVLLCTGDMGFTSAKTYDIEVWAPGQGSYLEVSSCSNCEDFQARRMNLRFKAETGQNKFPHILNGSGTALARLFVALVETHQQADGSVLIPKPLQPYLKAERISA